MNDGLLLVERYVLETLVKKRKSFDEIKRETGLKEKLVAKILGRLEERNLIKAELGDYCIDVQLCHQWNSTINSASNIKGEIQEILDSFLSAHFQQKIEMEKKANPVFKLKKISMNEDESKIFNSLISNVEGFLDNLQSQEQKNFERDDVKERRVIFWGHSPYLDILPKQLKSELLTE